jgi:hypothetical protein
MPASAQDGLAQPLQAEDQQQGTNGEPQIPDRQRGYGRTLPITTSRTGRTGGCTRVRLPGARIRPRWVRTSGFCARTGSAA